MAPTKSKPARTPATSERAYYIVNPAGCIHDVDRAHAAGRLRIAGWRMATTAEIAELTARGGEQRAGSPIAAPWVPDPDLPIDPDAA